MSTTRAGPRFAALAVATVVAWATRARRRARQARRHAALVETARRVDAAVAALRETPGEVTEVSEPAWPAVTFRRTDDGGGAPGRVALVDALGEAVAAARADDSRLSAAVVDAATVLDDALVAQLAVIAETGVYVVGPRSVAIVFPGLGRAAALGVLAKIEAAYGFQGRVVERERDEDAVELVLRLLTREPAN